MQIKEIVEIARAHPLGEDLLGGPGGERFARSMGQAVVTVAQRTGRCTPSRVLRLLSFAFAVAEGDESAQAGRARRQRLVFLGAMDALSPKLRYGVRRQISRLTLRQKAQGLT